MSSSRYRSKVLKHKKHIREPGSWYAGTLCAKDVSPEKTIPFPQTERELEALYETEVCMQCMRAAAKQLGGK